MLRSRHVPRGTVALLLVAVIVVLTAAVPAWCVATGLWW
jgi:hypothetical protein